MLRIVAPTQFPVSGPCMCRNFASLGQASETNSLVAAQIWCKRVLRRRRVASTIQLSNVSSGAIGHVFIADPRAVSA
jgi:hypothetical protein